MEPEKQLDRIPKIIVEAGRTRKTLIAFAILLVAVVVVAYFYFSHSQSGVPQQLVIGAPSQMNITQTDKERLLKNELDGCQIVDASEPRVLLAYGENAGQLHLEISSDVDGPSNKKYLYVYMIKNKGTTDISVQWIRGDKKTLGAAMDIAPNTCASFELESTSPSRIDKMSSIKIEATAPGSGTPEPLTDLSVYVPQQ